MSRRIFSALAVLLALRATVLPFSLNRNAAHIDWRTAETEHFRFHYAKELEDAAGYIAGIAEGVYNDKIQRYNIKLPNKVEFTIRDDIFSNGWANSIENTMNIWVTDWDFPVRSTHNWLKDVVTHEFSHLVSIQSGSKLPSYIQGVVIGFQDYYNKPVQGDFATIIPFTGQPNWFAEGVAQYESERSGYDAWDSHRDMMLRVAALDNKLLPIERMETFAGISIDYEKGPYTQGFALTRFISARYGDAALIRLWAEYSRLHRQTMSGAMKRVLGKTDRQVYEEWRDETTARFAEQVKALGPQVYGQKLTSKGFYNYYPRWDHRDSGIFFASNAGRDDFRAPVRHLKLADTTKKEEERLEGVPGVRGQFDVAPDDSTFVFASARETDKNGIHKIDVYQRKALRDVPFFENKDPTEKRVTKELNAANPSYSRDGSKVVFVRAEPGLFRLCVAPVPEGRKLDPEEVKTIFPSDSLVRGKFGFNIYTPKFSPDGKRILFSYFDGETRNVGLINTDGSGFVPILARPYDERDPEWAPDGKSFFFSADSNGIYNIYRYTFDSRAIQALTNVVGGAFSPAVDSSGTKIAYINYDKDGFSLYLLKDVKPPAQPLSGAFPVHPQTADVEAMELSGKSEKYLPIPTRGILTPIVFGEQLVASNHQARNADTKWLIGASGYMNDPVLKNEIGAALLVETGKGIDYFGAHDEILSPDKESQFFLNVSNHSTAVTLSAAFARGNLTSSDTVRIRSVDGTDRDTLQTQNYALTFRDAQVSATYNLFDASAVGDEERASFVKLTGGYNWNDFNFYDLAEGVGFAFTYYKSLYLNALFNLYGADYDDKGLVAPSGFAAALGYTLSQSDLVRNGTFQETFTFNSNGTLSPNYRTYLIHDLEAGATYGMPMPWSKHSALVASGFVGSILNWKRTSTDTARDTLDDFFRKGLFLRGYPYLRDVEHLAFTGENTATLSVDMNQPLWSDIYARFWTVFVEDIYADLFWEAGRAWDGPLWGADLFTPSAWDTRKHPDGWHQTVGLSFKVNARIYHNYPFLMYVDLDKALSQISDGKGGSEDVSTIKLHIGNGSYNTQLTQIRFGVAFGLYNGLLGRTSARHPKNPRSPFAAQ